MTDRYMSYAKAWVVDAIRHYLAKISPRNIGFNALCSTIHAMPADCWSALTYLRDRDEVTHEAHRGWRYVPQWEATTLRRITG